MIPSSSHPNWRKLITGELSVQPEFLATKFLLQHLNSVYRTQNSASALDKAVQE